MKYSRFRRRRLVLLAALVLAFGVAGIWFLFDAPERARELVARPIDVGTPFPAKMGITSQEQAFYDFFAPRLLGLTGETERLAELGRERSRNLLELQTRANRVERAADELDTYLSQDEPPPRFTTAVERYRSAMATVRKGMADARSALARFDWDGVAAGLAVFDSGAKALHDAYALLSADMNATGPATPISAADRVTFLLPLAAGRAAES